MKNIHILPTVQPSKLVKIKDTFFLTSTDDIPSGTFYNIYITFDKLFKENDLVLNTDTSELYKADSDDVLTDKKDIKFYADFNLQVILTTDPKLIADGIQEIDDEFLEWFIKNSSCEYIDIEKEYVKLVHNPNYKEFTPEGDGIYLTAIDEDLQCNETLVEDNLILHNIIIPNEKKYSDDEVLDLLIDFFDDHVNCQNANVSEWFNNHKKK